MLCRAALIFSATMSLAEDVGAQQPDTRPFAEDLVANVARIQAGDFGGFGFVVGLGDHQLLIATAYHTLEDSGVDTVTVCFPHPDQTCVAGTILYIADAIGKEPGLDLAFLAVPYPDRLAWRPDVMAEQVGSGAAVWSVGRGNSWYVPTVPGHISGADSTGRLIGYTGLSVAEGVSGAPIVTQDGIVAMHVQSLGEQLGAQGIALTVIERRLVDYARARWILVPRGECRRLAAARAAVGSRAFTVHFDADAPEAAMEATARLHCLGAQVTLAPVWDASAWPGKRVTYRRGGVRLLRALQSALASFGRFAGIQGEPAGDAELWVR